MMHSPYCTSILSLGSHTCFNDFYSYQTSPFPTSSSCSCCFSLPFNSCVPSNPNPTTFLYGLRQSSLIQCPPSRRLLLGSKNHLYSSRPSCFDLGSCCCFDSSCVKLRQEERVDRVRRNCCCCCNKERSSVGVNNVKPRMMAGPRPRPRPQSRRNLRVYALGGDAEAMLSLLTEDIVEECVYFREKTNRVPKGGRVVSKKKVVIEEFEDGSEDVSLEYRESKPKIQWRDEGRRRKEERDDISKEEDQRLRRKDSGSSCYTVSDSGEFGSDIEVEIEHEQQQEQERKQFVGESSISQMKDSRKSGGVVISEEVKQDWEKYRDDRNQELRSSRQNDYRVGGSIQENWRKKSEKKLTEESNYRNESAALIQSQLSQAKESSAMIASSSKQQFNFQKEQSTSDMMLQGQSSSRIQKDNRADEYLKSRVKNESLTQQRRENIETTSTSGRSSRRKEDLEIVDMSVVELGCEFCKTCGRSMEERNTQSNFKQQTELLKMSVDAKLNINAENMSEIRHRRQDEGSSSIQGSVVDESKQHSQTHMVTGQASSKQKSQHHLETSSASDTSIREQQAQTRMQSIAENSRISVDSQSESRRRKEGKSTSSIQTSAKEEKKLHDQLYLETGQLDARLKSQQYSETMADDVNFSRSNLRSQRQSETRKKHSEEKTSLSSVEELLKMREESSKVSHTDTGHSRVHSSDLEINRQSISDKRVYNEQTYSKAKVQSLDEVVEKRKRIEETIIQSTVRTDVQGPSTRHSSGEATISQPLTPSISQIRQELSGKETKSEQLLLTYPPYQHESQCHEASGSGMRNDVGKIVEVGSGSTQIHPQAISQPLTPSISQIGVQELSGKDTKSEQLALTYPTYQYESQFHEASGSGMRVDMGRITEVGSDNTQIQPHERSPSSSSEVDDDKSKQLSVISPIYQYESQLLEESSSGTRNDMGWIIEVGSGSTQIHPEARIPLSYSEDDDDKRKSSEGEPPEDALVSAARMQESSALIIGEFVEQMGHKASTSETSSEKRFSKQDLKYPDKKMLPKISPQSGIDNAGLQNQGSDLSSRVSTPESDKKESHIQESKHSSTDSLTKGSLDQMWDVKDHFVQEASEMESSEGAKSETTVSGRTGKFLWSIVAGIGRFRWGSRSEKQKSPVKQQISPTGSASGETWFSGDEVDEANGNGNNKAVEAEKIKLLQQSISDQSLLRTTTRRKEGVVTGVGDKLSLVDAGASSSSSALQGSSISGGGLVGQSTDLNNPQIMPLPGPSVGLSIPSAIELRRSLTFKELDEEENKETPVSSSEEQKDYFHEERQSDVSPSEETDVSPSEGGMEIDSKRRLQRSKQVLQRYDEWEDAYRREREQKKVDEIFMREALSEAIKAADSWEVPVGAVLVQNGKIIARGYNLVEELRDSTAHAEMICIREASNVLRTWRLSETTLYVTLEPCPMCAGAILQARISTLVWGAPNKLLGADGSWIRLFSEGMEGDERSEMMNKPAAPIHPFHPKMNIRRGILQEECADIMQQFFQLKRRKAKPKVVEPSEEPDQQPTCFPKPRHKSKLLHKMHNVFHPSNPSVD